MKLQNIKVSVIMACHNSSAYLEEAMRSVLMQTDGNLELLVIDDCSTDNTLEIAKSYQAQDNRILILSLPINSGPAFARNIGIHSARGDWIGILDSDDIAMPSRFEEQMRLAQNNRELIMIASNSVSIDKNGDVIKEHRYPTDHRNLVNRLYTFRAFPPHSSMLYRKDAIQALKGFNLRYLQSEDYDLWLRLSKIGRLTSVNKPLVRIRKHTHNISNANNGFLQLQFGYIALTCHFLRGDGHEDPSKDGKEITWQNFVKWVERRMTEEGAFERHQALSNVRSAFFSAQNWLACLYLLGKSLIQSRQATLLIREKLFGSSSPRHLAEEWVHYTR